MVGAVKTKVWYDKSQSLKEFLSNEPMRDFLGAHIRDFYFQLWREGSVDTWDVFWSRALNRKAHTCFTLRVSDRLLSLKHYLYNVANVEIDFLRPVSVRGLSTVEDVLKEAGIFLEFKSWLVEYYMSQGYSMGTARTIVKEHLKSGIPSMLEFMSPEGWRNQFGLVLTDL